MKNPNYDIIVFGATSFVGKIICQYLCEHAKNESFTWALAGRSKEKLTTLQAELGEAGAHLPLLVVDANDSAGLIAMCNQTKVILTTVGPYDLYGEPVVKACVETGTDYCDLTGEAHWIKKMLDKYESQAQTSGSRIVHCTGFDSIPSDLGVFHLQQAAKAAFGEHCPNVKLRIKNMRGSASGGTIATALNIAKLVRTDPAVKKVLVNPYALCPENHGFKTRQQKDGIYYDDTFNAWYGPFFMAGINTRIVHRSNALSQHAYGTDFKYNEGVLTGRGWKAKAKARSIHWGLMSFYLGASLGPIRALMQKFFLPKPGEGPSPKAQLKGFYDFRFVGTTDTQQQIITKVYGDRDPGYGSTAQIIGQAALCMAQDVKPTVKGGFWTPATLMGKALIERLNQHTGVSFEVLSTETQKEEKS
ncbi:saccharopine dehydrogenase NADP-binding domain-containing protein [Marinicella sp. S1101]|uniref:saccharopine dehydrogenase family protein n=1 Tax=Marinicella marina TaxID=2996016 RepID=UPI0022610265|nr:saccharopine dehydrogenase NADP-binding domain-containing protein [Marinicella marina]MCX7554026.1 saccharopine dehydrogenase NADP-binding domain-containing protein [Marinicella marina]MDJ1140518.1 saccharopine dehydrogenase NADP-binding domain-containing protein [Marinicella marina]